mmetsp:Transcript_108820/g.304094  ORF Transcript_108820/g.304094 Transcript_108820/m.304094 type:complete len:263 (+) Transcript_108820:195-983(+)
MVEKPRGRALHKTSKTSFHWAVFGARGALRGMDNRYTRVGQAGRHSYSSRMSEQTQEVWCDKLTHGLMPCGGSPCHRGSDRMYRPRRARAPRALRSHDAAGAAGRQGRVEGLVGRVVLLDGRIHELEPLCEAAPPALGARSHSAVAQEQVDAVCCKRALAVDSDLLDALPVERALPLLICEHILLEFVVGVRGTLLSEERCKLRGGVSVELTGLEVCDLLTKDAWLHLLFLPSVFDRTAIARHCGMLADYSESKALSNCAGQ